MGKILSLTDCIGGKPPVITQGKVCFCCLLSLSETETCVFWIQDPRQDRLALIMYRHSDASV